MLQSGRISGEVDWTQKSYTVSAGIHTFKWRYVKDDNSDEDGDDCGWVDFVQWTGASPVPDSNNWQQLDYKYDVYGRRSEKIIDGYPTRYLYDGPHVIAEYDGNNNLLRKYIYGPGVDQPISMIEVADSNATYYYHYDALGSVIALSDSSGDTVQTYEYSVFGEPAVEDANHTNPYMFAGRRYDIEIGLYYNRARYYNPYTGRFLQADPIGYGDGMNMYRYCRNNPMNFLDPLGTTTTVFPGMPIFEEYPFPVQYVDSGDTRVATGRYRVLPHGLDPCTVTPIELIQSGCDFLSKVVTIYELPIGIPGGTLLQPDSEGAIPGTETMAAKVGQQINGPWRAFIEVRDWNDVDGDGEIDYNSELTKQPYWIEIEGVGSGNDAEGTYDTADALGGYTTWADAADAAGTAVDWARQTAYRPGAVAYTIPTGADLGPITSKTLDNADPYGGVKYDP